MIRSLFLCLALTCLAVTTGACTAAQWASFLTNEAQFVTYVQTFLTGVQAVWAVVQVLIPLASLPTVTAAYNDALLTTTNALAALEDAAAAGNAANAAPANYGTLVADVQAAVAKLFNIVTQWQPVGASAHVTAATGVAMGQLAEQAARIKAWR
jgi:hypothetical protein